MFSRATYTKCQNFISKTTMKIKSKNINGAYSILPVYVSTYYEKFSWYNINWGTTT